MIIYRPTDRIRVQVGEVVLKVAPLTYEQKTQLLSHTVMRNGEPVRDGARSSFLTLKKAIKEVEKLPELKYADGSPVEFKWEDGELSEESLEVLLQVLGSVHSPQLSTALILGKYTEPPEGIVFGDEKKTVN